MSLDVLTAVASAAIATNGTQAFNYPANRTAGDYRAVGHSLYSRGLMAALVMGTGFTISFGASAATVTYLGTTSIPANTVMTLELDKVGGNDVVQHSPPPAAQRFSNSNLVRMSLGAPAATNAAGLAATQAIVGPAAAVLIATVMDVPRNVIAAWTTSATMTVVGKDEYGVVMSEAQTGIAFTGNKAFKTITSITITGASVTAFTAGWGNKIGLPVFSEGGGTIVTEIINFGMAVAGTMVGGSTVAPTPATNDARGTYVPNTAPNGANTYGLILAVDDNRFMGLGQA